MFPKRVPENLAFAFGGEGENGGGQRRGGAGIVEGNGHEGEGLASSVGTGIVEPDDKGEEGGVGVPGRAKNVAGGEKGVAVELQDERGDSGVGGRAATKPQTQLVSRGGEDLFMAKEGGNHEVAKKGGGSEQRDEVRRVRRVEDLTKHEVSGGFGGVGGAGGAETGEDEEGDDGSEDGEAISAGVGSGEEKSQGVGAGSVEKVGRVAVVFPVEMGSDVADGAGSSDEGVGKVGTEDKLRVGSKNGAGTRAGGENGGRGWGGHAFGEIDEGVTNGFANGCVGSEEAGLGKVVGEDLEGGDWEIVVLGEGGGGPG